ncbi:MAG: redox-active disulfide protein 2 [uncultured bacterium]|nr:MAG: redox-active disulfide protein 2 [uncultured bacterium]HBG20986.1 thioredoxin family protein [Desulfobulbaceae bacterium]
MKIHVLGPGCAKCTQLAETVTTAAKELGIDFELEKVTDFNKILSFGVMMTPGLVVDGEVKCIGRVPSLAEVKGMLK